MTRGASSDGAWRSALDHAIACRNAQRMVEAEEALAHAQRIAPDEFEVRFAAAMLAYERGRPAAESFGLMARARGNDRNVTAAHARALTSEGEGASAMLQLRRHLAADPHWSDGHRLLATIAWRMGDRLGFTDTFAAAVAAHPDDRALGLALFSTLAQVREWEGAARVLGDLEARFGSDETLIAARLFLAVETGDDPAAARLHHMMGAPKGIFTALSLIRLALRRGEAAEVEALAAPWLGGAAAGQLWPYLALAWRLLGDDRVQWLERDGALAQVRDGILPPDLLALLADALRSLHHLSGNFADQTIRLGTQTDRSILLRHEPVFDAARAAIMAAIGDAVGTLPPLDPEHPTLRLRDPAPLIAGSWSVSQHPGGYNVAHTHPAGWLSAVFYVASDALLHGSGDAGHLLLGAPPVELYLPLRPYRTVAPVPNRLVVFPSLLWHATAPILGGERLNIALDVVPRSSFNQGRAVGRGGFG